jgi:hypothetical protein
MPAYNSMFALWPGDWLNFSTFKPATFGYGGQRAASKAGHIANTNVGGHLFDPTDNFVTYDKDLYSKDKK